MDIGFYGLNDKQFEPQDRKGIDAYFKKLQKHSSPKFKLSRKARNFRRGTLILFTYGNDHSPSEIIWIAVLDNVVRGPSRYFSLMPNSIQKIQDASLSELAKLGVEVQTAHGNVAFNPRAHVQGNNLLASESEDLILTFIDDLLIKRAEDISDATLKQHVHAKSKNRRPVTYYALLKHYLRDPEVAEYAKRRANGICQKCNKVAPFINKKNKPYLEVLYIEPLSSGGADAWNNVVALCPNCHREIHHSNKDMTSVIASLKNIANTP